MWIMAKVFAGTRAEVVDFPCIPHGCCFSVPMCCSRFYLLRRRNDHHRTINPQSLVVLYSPPSRPLPTLLFPVRNARFWGIIKRNARCIPRYPALSIYARCGGGEELEALMTPEFSSPSLIQDVGRMSSRSLLPESAYGSDADAVEGLSEVRA